MTRPKASIHPQAAVSEGARIGSGCRIEAFAVVGPKVFLSSGVHLKPHAIVTGNTEIGDDSVVFPFACVGEIPQDLKYRGTETRLVVGKRNRIREGATLNTGTEHGGGVTRVGDDCLFMTGSHVGHDSRIGNRVVLANQAAIGGHCVIEDDVIIGGLSGVHQFVRVGQGAIIGAVTIVRRDVIPYGQVEGPAGKLKGINLVGLRRRNNSRQQIAEVRDLYSQLVSHEGPLSEVIEAIESKELEPDSLVANVLNFVRTRSERSLLKPE